MYWPVLIRGGVGGASVHFYDKLAQQLFKIDDIPRPGWARPHRPWLHGFKQCSRAVQEAAGSHDRSEVRTAT